MIYWVVTWAVKFRGIVIGVAAGLMLFGLFQFDSVKRDLLPEFSPTTVEVQTEALGLSAAEVEQFRCQTGQATVLGGQLCLGSWIIGRRPIVLHAASMNPGYQVR